MQKCSYCGKTDNSTDGQWSSMCWSRSAWTHRYLNKLQRWENVLRTIRGGYPDMIREKARTCVKWKLQTCGVSNNQDILNWYLANRRSSAEWLWDPFRLKFNSNAKYKFRAEYWCKYRATFRYVWRRLNNEMWKESEGKRYKVMWWNERVSLGGSSRCYATLESSWNVTLVLILNPASISTSTTALCPFRDARCNALCLSTVSLRRLGCFLSNSCTVSRRPYCAASSSGDSSLMFRIRGSQWCCKQKG